MKIIERANLIIRGAWLAAPKNSSALLSGQLFSVSLARRCTFIDLSSIAVARLANEPTCS